MLSLPLQAGPAAESAASSGGLAQTVERLALDYAPRIAAAVAIVVVGWFVSKAATVLLRKVLGRARVDVTLARFLASLTQMLLLTLVVVSAISKLGVETASFIAVLGAAGFAVGFALQGSLSNFAAGVMILIFRPFKAGDVIDAGGASGLVEEVGIFHTTLKTGDNKLVIVSNSAVTGGNITNHFALATRRIDLLFAIGRGDDLRKAKSLLADLMQAEKRVLLDPAPQIVVTELAEGGVKLACRPWVRSADYWDVLFELQERVKELFEREGIDIPLPQREVHLHQVA